MSYWASIISSSIGAKEKSERNSKETLHGKHKCGSDMNEAQI
jgi:hypothetical protein